MDHGGVGRGQQGGVPVRVLQALTGQGRASCGGADHETAGHLVRSRPELVTRALEPEHRVEDVDRDHGLAVGRIGRARRGEGRGGAGLVDPGVQDHTLGRLLVREHQLAVHGEVVLPVGVVDLGRGEERVHAEGAGLVGDDRHDAVTEVLLAHQVLEDAHEGHGGGRHLLARALLAGGVGALRGQRDLLLGVRTVRDESAQLLAALQHVLDLGGVRARVVVRGVVEVGLQLLVRDGNAQVVAEGLEILQRELLHLVGGVARLEVRAQAVALDALRQDHGGLALVLQRRLVRRVDLVVVVGAALEVPDLLVGVVRHELLGGRGPGEEVVAHEAAGLRLEGLVVAVQGLVHDAHELTGVVSLEQGVPLAAPHDLDDVPAGTPEERLQLLDDLAVAAHGAVETLQVAVDHEGQVVQLVVGRELQHTARLGLVHLAVAEERPDVLLGGVLDPAVVQVAVELRLVHGVHGPDAHGHGGELPEVGQAARVGVGGQAVRGLGLLLTEPVQLLFREAAL